MTPAKGKHHLIITRADLLSFFAGHAHAYEDPELRNPNEAASLISLGTLGIIAMRRFEEVQSCAQEIALFLFVS